MTLSPVMVAGLVTEVDTAVSDAHQVWTVSNRIRNIPKDYEKEQAAVVGNVAELSVQPYLVNKKVKKLSA